MDDRLAEAEIVSHALHHILVERRVEQGEGFGAIGRPCDQLTDHGVVVHGNLTALLHSRVDPNVFVGIWLPVLCQKADGGEEFARRVLCVDAVLN